MKRYLVFAGDRYYPHGGWRDFKGSFDTREEARKKALEYGQKYDWQQIIDIHSNVDLE
jgi:hypothetical protein